MAISDGRNLSTACAAISDFWEREGSHYDATIDHGICSAAERVRWTAALAAIPDSSRVLDVGTGTGFVALLLATLGHHVTGLDASAAMLRRARVKAEIAGADVAFEQGRAERLPYPRDSFAAVTARHLIWTLIEPMQAFAEWHRVLVPGGMLIADCSLEPQLAAQHYADEVAAALPFYGVTDPSPVVQELTAAQFVDVECQLDTAHNGGRRALIRCRAM